VMLGLNQYSFVYWNTHAGTLDDGDILIVTGESNAKPYAKYYDDKTMIQAYVAGDPTKTLYNSITGAFLTKYVGAFPAHSVWFLNGCRGLDGPTFWNDLQSENVDALISWHEQAQSSQDDAAGAYVMSLLGAGQTVGSTVQQAIDEGYGLGLDNGTPAELGFRGDGALTLHEPLTGVAPTPTATPTGTLMPTSTPTATPTPFPTETPAKLPLRVSLAKHSLQGGVKQTISIKTSAYAAARIVVRFPDNKTKTHTSRASSGGVLHWSFVEPRGTTTGKSRIVRVTVTVHDPTGAHNTATKTYTTG
jgi:hypothetical protein